MKYIFTLSGLLMLFLNANCQLEKKTWLLGGSASLTSSKYEYQSTDYSTSSKNMDIMIAPTVGYFFWNSFAGGLKTGFKRNRYKMEGEDALFSKANRFYFGPFIRAYLLNIENPYNILAEVSYQRGAYYSRPTKGTSDNFDANVGAVIFFNSSVGLEFLLGYFSTKETINQGGENITQQSGVQMGLGFQFHLAK